jgi:hypothetical protein
VLFRSSYLRLVCRPVVSEISSLLDATHLLDLGGYNPRQTCGRGSGGERCGAIDGLAGDGAVADELGARLLARVATGPRYHHPHPGHTEEANRAPHAPRAAGPRVWGDAGPLQNIFPSQRTVCLLTCLGCPTPLIMSRLTWAAESFTWNTARHAPS